MTQELVDNYLRRLRRGLGGCSKKVKESVVMEIASDIDSRIQISAGDSTSVILSLEDPIDLGRALRAVHGSGISTRLRYMLVAPLLGFASYPAFQSVIPSWPVNLCLLLGTILVIRGASLTGRITGAIIGGLMAAPRILLMLGTGAALGFIQNAIGYEAWTIDGGTMFVVILTSLMLPILGFFIGKRVSSPL